MFQTCPFNIIIFNILVLCKNSPYIFFLKLNEKNGMTNIDIKIFIFMPPKQPCRLSPVFCLKNKIFEIS